VTTRFRILILSLLLTLAACGHDGGVNAPPVTEAPVASGDSDSGGEGSDDASGEDDTTEETVEIVASLGLINGADVSITTPDGTALEGAVGALDETGKVTISHDGSYTGPIVVSIVGNDTATYFDESAGSNLPMPSTVSLRAYAPAMVAEIGVTILTELAAQVAAEVGSDISAADIETINNSIRDTFAPDLSDILAPPAIVSEANFTDQSLSNDDAGIYALTLAGLATLSAVDASPALAILEQLTADLADGDIDGNGLSGALSDLDYTPEDFGSLLSGAIQTAAAILADADLVATANSISITIDANILESVIDAGVPLPDSVADRITDFVSGGTDGGVDISGDFDLTISGEIITLGVGAAFDLTINNIVAPSPDDTTEVKKVIEDTVSGLNNITELTVTIVKNTETQVTFDVSFSATQSGLDVTLNLRYDYVKAGTTGDDTASGDSSQGETDNTGDTSADDIAALGKVCFFGGEPIAVEIPDALSGVWHVTYSESSAGAPYSDGELAHFTINDDGKGTMDINRQTILMTPVKCGSNEHEAIWKDSQNNVIYSLSSLVTGFNEINVNSATDGSFLGQFANPE
jgi:hypothetical protein